MSFNGDYLSLAEACGEAPSRGLAFIPGVDFDPTDPDDCEAVRLASERDYFDRLTALERENERLRKIIENREI